MKTSKADFEVFKKSVRRWIKELGLVNWDITIVHKTSDKRNDSVAWVSTGKYGTQVATIALCTEYDGIKINKTDIDKAGFHEVCHLLLYNVESLGESRFGVSREDYDKEIHSLITVLENTLWKNLH